MLKRSEDMYSYLGSKGLIFCRGFVGDYVANRRMFKKALFLEKGKWIWKNNIVPDLIYDRSLFTINKKLTNKRKKMEKDFPYLNNLKLSELFSNKWLTYKKFQKYSPKTVLIKNSRDFSEIKKLKSSEIIMKPIFGSGGDGIKISVKEKAKPIKFPFIAQELICATKGIPGLVKGPHDLRMMMAGEKLFHAFLRIPPKGKFIANLACGSKIKVVSPEDIPESVKKVLKDVVKSLKTSKKKLYAIDFIIDDNGKAWIIEINSRPGIILEKAELPYRKKYYNNLLNFFLK